MSRWLIAFAVLLTGCDGRQVKECPAPITAVVRQTAYVPIDASLTGPVEDTAPKLTTVRSAVVAAKVREEALGVCNARLEAIRALQGTSTTERD